ncbi:MAG: translation initiation factor IF-2 [Mycoplasma sp.]|nr:translation initiation factor IF-2 [Mycoplasma sp.]
MAKKVLKRKTNAQAIKDKLKRVDVGVKDGVFIYSGPLSISDFAQKSKIHPNDVIKYFFKNGKMMNINEMLDEEMIAEVCIEFDLDFQKEKSIDATNFMNEVEIVDEEENLETKPPIITVMGHVDHGKTTLIDYIRKSNVVQKEKGGITQHTGAYKVDFHGFNITFLDTPGHEAFSQMRARGAQVTDIVVIVVAADDGVMKQTVEAIDHAKAANVPIIIFVNKMDKHTKDLERIKNELSEHGLITDEWGGDTMFVYGSALKGDGIQDLYEAIKLQAEVLDLKANPNRLGIGRVIETRIDKGHGTVATIIVENGSILKNDFIVAGSQCGKIKKLTNTYMEDIDKALPGEPAVIIGLSYPPNTGDKFFIFHDEKFAKKIATEKAEIEKKRDLNKKHLQTKVVNENGKKVFNVIIKSDVQGTAEAIKYSLNNISSNEVEVHAVLVSVGKVTRSDILLAIASNAMIVAFNLRIDTFEKELAKQEGIELKTYDIIYKIIEDIEAKIKGLEAPKYKEEVIGRGTILKVIFASKHGNIAGTKIDSGLIKNKSKIRILRKGKEIFKGRISSLQREQNQAKEVKKGFECGINIYKFNDIKEEDVIEAYEEVRIN